MHHPTGADGDTRRWHLDHIAWDRLVRQLMTDVDEVIGPVMRSGVVRLRRLTDVGDLAIGVVDAQDAGSYRATGSSMPTRFDHGPGPDSLKAIVHPAETPVWTIRRRDGELRVEPAPPDTTTRAVIGVRDCDLRALQVLERTQTSGPHPDASFAARRDGFVIVAVDCTRPAATCFCTSTGGGPAASTGFDIALTELADDADVHYVARAGSARGAELLDLVANRADPAVVARADIAVASAADVMVRTLPDHARTIVDVPDHARWAEVAERCLACGNCTAVCPTCFCTDLVDEVSLDGETSTRRRTWDTCFSEQYSALGGEPYRRSTASRYRQWLTHKLGTWWDQFDESGCVGCGRCITWCPVGIDLTDEVAALLQPEAVAP